MNLFDGIQEQMFDTVGKIYGYNASWTPSAGGAAITGRVLLNEPTNEYDLNGVPYTPFHRIMEYRLGTLPGLLEAVRGKKSEAITINGAVYYVRNVRAKYDGKTFVAEVEKSTS